ncbi:MAG: hypothetical protein R2864_09655 [Syntrophotaleaceae bacterium]
MNLEQQRCLIIAEFNHHNLAGYLNHGGSDDGLSLLAECGPYGQVASLLVNDRADCWDRDWAGLVVWSAAESVSPAYQRALEYQSVAAETVLAEVEAFAGQIRRAAGRASCVLVPTWTRPTCHRGLGMLDWDSAVGAGNLLARMNLRLSECLADLPQVFTRCRSLAGGGRRSSLSVRNSGTWARSPSAMRCSRRPLRIFGRRWPPLTRSVTQADRPRP